MPADAISQSTAEKIPENYRRSDLRHGYDDHPAMKSMKPHCAFHLSHLGDRKPHLHDKGDEFRAEELLTVELDVVRDEVVVLLRHKKALGLGCLSYLGFVVLIWVARLKGRHGSSLSFLN